MVFNCSVPSIPTSCKQLAKVLSSTKIKQGMANKVWGGSYKFDLLLNGALKCLCGYSELVEILSCCRRNCALPCQNKEERIFYIFSTLFQQCHCFPELLYSPSHKNSDHLGLGSTVGVLEIVAYFRKNCWHLASKPQGAQHRGVPGNFRGSISSHKYS